MRHMYLYISMHTIHMYICVCTFIHNNRDLATYKHKYIYIYIYNYIYAYSWQKQKNRKIRVLKKKQWITALVQYYIFRTQSIYTIHIHMKTYICTFKQYTHLHSVHESKP